MSGQATNGLYVILRLEGGSSEDEDEPFTVYQGATYETLEQANAAWAGIPQFDEASYQIGHVIPLDGDPDF